MNPIYLELEVQIATEESLRNDELFNIEIKEEDKLWMPTRINLEKICYYEKSIKYKGCTCINLGTELGIFKISPDQLSLIIKDYLGGTVIKYVK